MRRAVLALTVCLLVVPAPSAQAFRLGEVLAPIVGNPADALSAKPLEASRYEPATRCTPSIPRPGIVRLERWLGAHTRGVSWGDYRCERWGPHEASLHAERRAIDWHLDVSDPADRRAARKLIELLLAPDADGQPQALARRMGVEELIWDCSYWSAGMTEFSRYGVCFGKDGRTPRRHVDPTVAHRNHIHIGMTKAGAMARTSFWTARRG